MKKFILMLAISLGGVFSAQAQNQSFSFNCSAAENVTLSVTTELSTPQMVAALVGGYLLTGDAGEEILERTTGANEQFYVAHGEFYYEEDGITQGPFAYRVFAQFVDLDNIGGLSYHDNAEEALAALNIAPIEYQDVYPDVDENQLLLAGYTFNGNNYVNGSNIIPPPYFINGVATYGWETVDGGSDFEGTIADALAYYGLNG